MMCSEKVLNPTHASLRGFSARRHYMTFNMALCDLYICEWTYYCCSKDFILLVPLRLWEWERGEYHEKNTYYAQILVWMFCHLSCVYFSSGFSLVSRTWTYCYHFCPWVLYVAMASESTANERFHSARKKYAASSGSLYTHTVSKRLEKWMFSQFTLVERTPGCP